VISILIGVNSFAQTATNFTCNDCNGGSHDLFTELDAGKVVVLCWVMPCSSCIPNSKTSYNVVNSFQTSNPGRVFFYMVDDYGDTPCNTLNSWANSASVSIPQSSFSQRFVNTSINMTNYGATGMPKIVVLGGATHTVFFNSTVTAFNSTNLLAAINNALAATSGIESLYSGQFNASLFPIPSSNKTTLTIELKSLSNVKVELYNLVGKKVSELIKGQLSPGKNEIPINTSELSNGIYFIKVSVTDREKTIKLVVSN
jgi:hypothetical protein